MDTSLPYQHPEMFVALAYFFKDREAVGVLCGEFMPSGVHGTQIPDAMLALTATAVSVHSIGRRSLTLTRPAKRSSSPFRKLLLDNPHSFQRDSVARSTRATSPQSDS